MEIGFSNYIQACKPNLISNKTLRVWVPLSIMYISDVESQQFPYLILFIIHHVSAAEVVGAVCFWREVSLLLWRSSHHGGT